MWENEKKVKLSLIFHFILFIDFITYFLINIFCRKLNLNFKKSLYYYGFIRA